MACGVHEKRPSTCVSFSDGVGWDGGGKSVCRTWIFISFSHTTQKSSLIFHSKRTSNGMCRRLNRLIIRNIWCTLLVESVWVRVIAFAFDNKHKMHL